jgi:hypothetical protein
MCTEIESILFGHMLPTRRGNEETLGLFVEMKLATNRFIKYTRHIYLCISVHLQMIAVNFIISQSYSVKGTKVTPVIS